MDHGSTFRMPFGKHKGRPLYEVPSGYLVWCLDACEFIAERPWLRALVEEEWRRRIEDEDQSQDDEEPPRSSPSDTIRHVVTEFVRAGYRALVKQHHPDHGGDSAEMVLVNEKAETLRRAGWL
jgi:hypothetical protein